jgi:hypothetical protein
MSSYGFPHMADIIPEGKCGSAEIKHVTVSQHDSNMSARHGGEHWVPAGKYAQLHVDGKLMMSDTRHERITNLEFVRRAHGKVLIGGLGLGMILKPILAKPEVDSVLVIEQSDDVIGLIWPHVENPKLDVWKADVFTWNPPQSLGKWQTIYLDIWPDLCTDNLPQIARLHQKYKYYLDRTDPDCWMGSWEQDTLRSQKRSR